MQKAWWRHGRVKGGRSGRCLLPLQLLLLPWQPRAMAGQRRRQRGQLPWQRKRQQHCENHWEGRQRGAQREDAQAGHVSG